MLVWIVYVLVAIHAPPSLGFHHVLPRHINHKPTQVIAGVTVIDTPLVRAAQAYAREVSATVLYNHVMRTWLYGALVFSHNATLQEIIDLEVHAIGSMLHDLGLVLNGTWISQDRRFEVDSAFATADFVEKHLQHDRNEVSGAWDANRLQLLFDSVLLSSEYKFSLYKQSTVTLVITGVLVDVRGIEEQSHDITTAEYDSVEAAFPRLDFISGVNQTLVELCATKPNSTYDSWQQAFGDAFVPGYSAEGSRFVDIFGHSH
ncbi:uncharacterized protein RAG0_15710 [Rhynchosporium agropyri]|uniref:HD domain-containing protein n=1 Tax=Rhynchosporium agropyri TaxID=914238 RepID=A0A1E1LMA0_9HELO|nr:uncharacterized protein RAG0_15710 [Rhynchosporium agropyri]